MGSGSKKGIKPKVGDVFLVTIDTDRRALGQVAGDWRGELYVVIFENVVSPTAIAADVIGRKPMFAALTLDAKFFNGDWSIIGAEPENVRAIPQPVFKVGQNGEDFLESRDRSFSRAARPGEAEQLRLRTVVAPVRVEMAVKAANGVGAWQDRFDDLRADYAFTSSLFGASGNA